VIHALPRPRTPDPKTAPALRWGILGPGWIAQRFTAAVQQHSEQKIVAVASRSATRAARDDRKISHEMSNWPRAGQVK
jgi:predicted dehydrogenase